MVWRREGNQLIEYDSNGIRTGKAYDFTASGKLSNKNDGFIVNHNTGGFWGFGIGPEGNRRFIGSYHGTEEQLTKALEMFLSTGQKPTQTELNATKKEYENVMRDVQSFIKYHKINEEEYSKEVATRNAANAETNTLNPYAAYLEEQRSKQGSAELGLLNETTKANIQNAEISAQQSMIQQAQFKDQLVEQIKTDRLSKMRAGLTPMQIAQEDLQFMVGNMQGNNQNMQMMNQQRLAAQQQQAINPYQAYINANAAITGGQGHGNVASGFAATDAGDLYQQALRIAQSKGRTAPSDDDFLMAQGQKQG